MFSCWQRLLGSMELCHCFIHAVPLASFETGSLLTMQTYNVLSYQVYRVYRKDQCVQTERITHKCQTPKFLWFHSPTNSGRWNKVLKRSGKTVCIFRRHQTHQAWEYIFFWFQPVIFWVVATEIFFWEFSTPRKLGKIPIPILTFDEHIFQMGLIQRPTSFTWFKCQYVEKSFGTSCTIKSTLTPHKGNPWGRSMPKDLLCIYPIPSMYGIFTYIHHRNNSPK